jgi:hypothetical protein
MLLALDTYRFQRSADNSGGAQLRRRRIWRLGPARPNRVTQITSTKRRKLTSFSASCFLRYVRPPRAPAIIITPPITQSAPPRIGETF